MQMDGGRVYPRGKLRLMGENAWHPGVARGDKEGLTTGDEEVRLKLLEHVATKRTEHLATKRWDLNY